MARKHYLSDSSIAVNVQLESGSNMHIAFVPLTRGGSYYITDKVEVQKALERHYRFGDLFTLDHVDEDKAEEQAMVEEDVQDKTEGEDTTTIKVHDLGEAKDYLAEHYGVSRTSLRTKKSILDAAQAQGVSFEGLDEL